MCSMGVSIAASSAVAGAVPRGRATRIMAAVQLMAPSCSNDAGYSFSWSAAASDGSAVNLVGPGGQCSPRHAAHFEPSFLESNGTL